MPDLLAAATELYALLPSEFVAARDARSAEARSTGDRQLASAIKALRRPTTSAWLANWLARERAEALDRLLSLGAAMRQAQDHLAGDELRQLSRQRHQVVTALATEARRAAADAGLSVGEQAASELEATLNAALADDGAADSLRSGQLVTALEHTGFGPTSGMSPRTAVASKAEAEPDASKSRRADAESAAKSKAKAQAEADHRRHRDAATEDLRRAESTAADAARNVAQVQELVEEARMHLARAEADAAALQEQLDAARAREGEATAGVETVEGRLSAAQSKASHADEQVTTALAELARWQ